MEILNNLTVLEQLVLSSIAGGVSGGIVSGVVYEVIDIVKQRVDDNRNRCSKMIDIMLFSVGLGLLSGAMTFAFGAVPIFTKFVAPLSLFTVDFITAGMISFLGKRELIHSRSSSREKSN